MPSSSNAKESAMTMSGTSNNNEVGGVHVSTARGSTENASSRKQIPERVAEEASGRMSMAAETSSSSTPNFGSGAMAPGKIICDLGTPTYSLFPPFPLSCSMIIFYLIIYTYVIKVMISLSSLKIEV